MLLDMFERGGPVMWPLLIASIVALALILERALVFAWRYQRFGPVVRNLEPLVKKGLWERAAEWCQARSGPFTDLAQVYFALEGKPDKTREHILSREATLLVSQLEKRLRWLATLAQVATLLGLLGTFYFMIYRFRPEVTASGQVPQAEFFAAIWESFLSTMFGLIVAIPCTAAYSLFESRVDAVARDLEVLVSYLDEWSERADAVAAPKRSGNISASNPKQSV